MIVWISSRWETQQLARSSKALAGDNYSGPRAGRLSEVFGQHSEELRKLAKISLIRRVLACFFSETTCRYAIDMNGREFVRRAKRFAARNGLDFRFERGEGKGSHGQLYVGRRRTMVKRTELSKGLLRNMLRDLGINKEDF